MENSNTIQTELLSLSPLIAALGKGNLFVLPEGYFEDLPGNILRLARVSDLNKGFENHQATESVPDGYFDQLAGSIFNRIKAQTSEQVGSENSEISAELASLKYKTTLEIPADYFNSVTDSILKKIEALDDNVIEETSAISGLVSSLDRKNLFSLPDGYFDNLARQVQIRFSPAARVVSISKFRSFFKYAAAAMVISAISIAVVKYNNQGNTGYTSKLDGIIQSGIKMDNKKFDETLNTLSQDDILQYLEKNSSDEDVATLTADLEDKTLPAEDEYLVDEKTLDKFIEAINTKN